jgi:hypothetical protein
MMETVYQIDGNVTFNTHPGLDIFLGSEPHPASRGTTPFLSAETEKGL